MVMRTKIFATAVAVAICTYCNGSLFAADEVDDGSAPDFALKSTTGPNLRLSEYRGEVVLLTFWASWCGECRTQLKEFEALHQSYGESGLAVLAVNLDPQMAQARDTAQSLGLTYPVLHDVGGVVGEMYEVDDMPLVVFIDREGQVREVVEGFSRTEQDHYADQLRNLLRE